MQQRSACAWSCSPHDALHLTSTRRYTVVYIAIVLTNAYIQHTLPYTYVYYSDIYIWCTRGRSLLYVYLSCVCNEVFRIGISIIEHHKDGWVGGVVNYWIIWQSITACILGRSHNHMTCSLCEFSYKNPNKIHVFHLLWILVCITIWIRGITSKVAPLAINCTCNELRKSSQKYCAVWPATTIKSKGRLNI